VTLIRRKKKLRKKRQQKRRKWIKSKANPKKIEVISN
jgi:hypothetical protein